MWHITKFDSRRLVLGCVLKQSYAFFTITANEHTLVLVGNAVLMCIARE